MQLDTKVLKGCKVLHKIPAYLKNAQVKNGDKIIEMGTLSNYKKFMIMHKFFDGASQNYSMETEKDNFSGCNNYDDFLKLVDNGDENIMRKIKVETSKQIAELTKKYEDVIHRYKFDTSGQFFDVGLVLTGIPETWLEPDNVEEEKIQVEIIINGSFPSGANSKDVVLGASRILAMVKILEDNGVEVKVKIVACINKYYAGRGNKSLFVATDVKDYDEPINYKKASALLSPTYLRRGMLKVMELLAKEKLAGNYGRPVYVDDFIGVHKTQDIDKLEKKLFKQGV